MKKIKLFAIAALLLGSTNAFAAEQASNATAGGFKLKTITVTGVVNPVEIVGFANDYQLGTGGVITIPSILQKSEGDSYTVVGIADNAFDAYDADLRLNVKKVVIDAKIKYIGANTFDNFGNLASVEFGTSSATSDLEYIGDGAFAQNPMLKSISFANCPKLLYFTSDGKQKTGVSVTPANTYTTPFVNSSATTNTALTTVTLYTGTQDFGSALANLENLETLNIKDTQIRVLNGNALTGNKKITALELPGKKHYDVNTGELLGSYAVKLEDDALAGTVIQTLTINGDVDFVHSTVGALGVPATTGTGAKKTLTTVIFKGKVGDGTNAVLLDGAFKGNENLKTVTFEDVVDVAAVGAGAFEGAGTYTPTAPATIALTVSALKAVTDAFAQNAFVASSTTTPSPTPTENVEVKVNNLFTLPTATCWRVSWNKAVTADKIYVESNDGTTFYAKFCPGSDVAISRKKGDVVVYSAYADGATIYMDPLASANDKYIIANGKAVIVKVKNKELLTSDEKGQYIEVETPATGAQITMRYVPNTASSTPTHVILDDIQYGGAKMTNQAIISAAPTGKVAYAVAKISANGLKWQAISNEGTFNIKEPYYIYVASSSPVRVVWLDEEGNATAIQNVKTAKAENGAIYNLAGQKVNAAYKGVVIKDGKKYIQK